MWKKEYLRYLKSKRTWVLLALVLVSLVSFFISLSEKQMFLSQQANPSPDQNQTALATLIANFTGIRFVFDFWYVSDYFVIFMAVLLIWAGVFLSATLQTEKEAGHGSMLVTRCSYQTYVKSILAAQSLYILTVVAAATALMTLVAMGIGGTAFPLISLGAYDLNPPLVLLTMAAQVIWMSLFLSLINGICLLSNVWVKSKFVIQALPLVVFSLAPTLLVSTVGNLVPSLGNALLFFIPWEEFKAVEFVFQEHFSLEAFVLCLVPMAAYGVLLFFLYQYNVKKHKESYV